MSDLHPTSCSICGAPLPSEVSERHCAACALSVGPSEEGEDFRAAETLAIWGADIGPDGGPASPRPAPDDGADPLIGQTLGGYRILERISRGGMGMVYKARDLALERLVALKALAPEISEKPDCIARFQREARAVAALSHPNIVPIFSIGDQDGRHFFAMEYVQGMDLSRRIREQGPLKPLQALQVAIQVGGALAVAHGAGIIHRDIKPHNIMMGPSGRIQVLDFGLATFLQPIHHQTETSTFMGTPCYASPEQCEGGAIDGRSDLYALGVTLFECLTGLVPYRSQSPAGLVREILVGDPRPLIDEHPELPEPARALVARLLAKRPDDRFANARDFIRHAREVERQLILQGDNGGGLWRRTIWLEMEIAQLDGSAAGQRPNGAATPDADLTSTLADFRQDIAFCGGQEWRGPDTAVSERTGPSLAPPEPTDSILPGAVRVAARFDHPMDAIRAALGLQRVLARRPRSGTFLVARAGIHLEAVHEPPGALEREEEQSAELEAAARAMAGRLRRLSSLGQTLLTHQAFDMARCETLCRPEDRDITWVAHGPYSFEGHADLVEVFEVGLPGQAPLAAPANQSWARSTTRLGDEATLGWRPAAGLSIPTRPMWRLVECVGQGGFGEVWLTRHVKTGQQRVFKFCFEARRLQALKREVTLFRLLKQTLGSRPDIYKVLDWSFEEAPFYIESEYTEGGSLIDWAREQGGLKAMPLETRIELVAQAATALAAAHSVGLIHRDIKPANILVRCSSDGAPPQAILADFGVGLVTGAEVFDGQDITITGMTELIARSTSASLSGTRLYLAPELLEGKPLTIQADIYALGMLLYQMVVGDFHRSLGVGWQRHIPDDLLAEDIAACVDHDPERRLSSASELASRLRALAHRRARRQAEQEARRQAQETAARLARSSRRRRVLAAFLALALVFLVVVSGLAMVANALRREAQRSQQETAAVNQQLAYDLYTQSIQRVSQMIFDGSLSQAQDLLYQQDPAQRHWEWGYLLRMCHPEMVGIDLDRPPASISGYGYSPRKTWILIAANDQAHIYDTRTAEPVHAIDLGQADLEPADILSFAFTADERFLALGAANRRVILFDTADWQWVGAFVAPLTPWTLAICRQDTRILAFSGPDQDVSDLAACVLSLDPDTPQAPIAMVTEMPEAMRPFNTLALSPDERWLALPAKPRIIGDRPFRGLWRDVMLDGASDLSAQEFGIEVWDLDEGRLLRRLGAYGEVVTALRFLPDGRRLLSGAHDQSVTLWDVTNGEPDRQYRSIVDGVSDIILDGAESVAMALDMRGNFHSFDVVTGQPLGAFSPIATARTTPLWGRLFPDDGSLFVVQAGVGGEACQLARFRGVQLAHTLSSPLGPDPLRLDAYLNGPGLLTVGQNPPQVQVVNLFPESVTPSWDVNITTPSALFFSPDVSLATFQTTLGVLGLVDVVQARRLDTLFRGHNATIVDVAFSPDNRRMVTASKDLSLRLWDTQTGREIFCHYVDRFSTAEPMRIRFSADGQTLVAGYSDGTLEVFDTFPWCESDGATPGAGRSFQRERYATWMAERQDLAPGVVPAHRVQEIRDLLDSPRPRPRPDQISRAMADLWWDICASQVQGLGMSEWDRGLMIDDTFMAIRATAAYDSSLWEDLCEKISLAYRNHPDYYVMEAVQANPEWELSPSHPNHPQNPALLRRRATSSTERAIIGHWDFSGHDLSAAIGPDMDIHDASTTGQARLAVRFGMADTFGIPNIDDVMTPVMAYPAFTPDEGIVMPLEFPGNGGGVFLNQYTLIMDLYVPQQPSPVERSLLQTYHRYLLNSELSISPQGAIGIQRQRFGPVFMDSWNRIAVSVDLPRAPFAPTTVYYLNGKRIGEQIYIDDRWIDGRFALRPINLLLTGKQGETAPGYLSCVQVRNYPMDDEEIAALGGPTSQGIATDLAPIGARDGPGPVTIDPDRAFQHFRVLVSAGISLFPHQREPMYLQALEHMAAIPDMDDFTIQRAAHLVRNQVGPYRHSLDNPMYNLRLQNPGLELPPGHPNKMPPPDHPRPSEATPAPAILGYWDFAQADWSAQRGPALEYVDTRQSGALDRMPQFGGPGDLGAPDLPGGAGAVVALPEFRASQSIVMALDFAPNGGGQFLNQYTLLMDVCVPESAAGKTRALLRTHQQQSMFSEFYIDDQGGIGVLSPFHGGRGPRVWRRIGIVVELTRPPDRRDHVHDGNVLFYIDGQLVGQESVCRAIPAIDSNYALRPVNQLFTDHRSNFTAPLFVSAIQVRNYSMSAEEMALLGGASGDGIATDLRLDLNRHY